MAPDPVDAAGSLTATFGIAPVPLPAGLVLFAPALAGLGAFARRRAA